MDHRVKPGGDEEEAASTNPETLLPRSPAGDHLPHIVNESAECAGEQA